MTVSTAPATTPSTPPPPKVKRVRTPTLLQLEAVECGAACLGMILAHYGKHIPLEELRVACGVSRDGSSASNVIKAAKNYGMNARGLRRDGLDKLKATVPAILFWNFNHFVVFEGWGNGVVYLNDPASGPRTITLEEFDESFTGVALVMEPGNSFQKSGQPFNTIASLAERLGAVQAGVIFVLLVSLFLLIPGFAIPTFLRVFVDDILIGNQSAWLTPLLIGIVLMLVLQLVLTWVQQTFLLRLEYRLSLSASGKFIWRVLQLPTTFFAQRYTGDVAYRVNLNEQIAQLLSGRLATTVIDVLLAGFYGLLMLQYDVLLTLISIAVAVINLAVLRYISTKLRDANFRLLLEGGRLMGTAYSGLSTIEALKATGLQSDFFSRWAGYQAKTIATENEIAYLNHLIRVVPPLFVSVNTALVLFIGAQRVFQGDFSIGMLIAFQVLLASFTGPVLRLASVTVEVQESQASLAYLDDVLHYPLLPGDRLDQQDEVTSSNAAKLRGRLELRNLTFGYSPLAPPLIEDFNLTLEPGQRIALVGGSGSGKSTVARLVAGLFQPWSGDILFDGKRREDIPRAVMKASLSMVDQEIQLFAGTIRDNLTLWNPSIPQAQIVQAAKDAAIHDRISRLKGLYDAVIDENGRNFSGGERQRLEIARALVMNPRLLILDEATSALDPITEKQIDDNLRRRGCSCLIVAHRLSTIRDADEIIVMDHGKIVERGTHQQLLALKGAYAALISAEAGDSPKRSTNERITMY